MLVAEYDYATDIAVQRGEAFGVGIEQGEHRKAIETANILKKLGDPLTKIMEVTGLSKEEIEEL